MRMLQWLIVGFGLGMFLGCHEGDEAARDGGPRDLRAVDSVSGTPGDLARAGDLAQPDGPSCGFENTGRKLVVAPGIELCLPQTVCTAETCPPPLGQCQAGDCVYNEGYQGIATLPEAWATHYCALKGGGCHGVTQIDFAEVNAAAVSARLSLPLCEDDPGGTEGCVGIAASSPMIVGNSQEAIDPATDTHVRFWGLGYTEASGLCYELKGPGRTVVVALTDRCGGYCRCGGSGYQECGPCVSASDMEPHCGCVGSVPGLFADCCGLDCPMPTRADCDWCASNNHPHFDLDTAGFNALCGEQASRGSCRLSAVRFIPCLPPKNWPPGGAGGCKEGSFYCTESPGPNQVKVPGVDCCCNWNLQPQPDGSCA